MEQPSLFNKEAEESVIGSVMVDPGCFPLLDLTAEHFHVHRNGLIWNVFAKLYQKDTEIDFVTVTDELARQDKLDYAGGFVYITNLINNVPTSQNAQHYADIIKDYAARRRLRDTATKMARLAYDKDAEIDKEIGGLMGELTGSVSVKHGAVHISKYTKELRDEVIARSNDPKEVWGIPTGFIDFDHITGGLQKGESLILSGDPGIGKSTWAMQAGFQMAFRQRGGAIYSLEMPGKAVARRRVSHMAQIPARNMKTGNMTDKFWIEFDDAIRAIDDLPLYLSDEVSWTIASLRADLARLKAIYDIEWALVDYELLLQDKAKDEIEKTALISTGWKGICRSLDIAGIMIASENKEGMDDDKKKPRLKSGKALRGSGQQFYDADLLLFLTPGMQENVVVCQFGKGRELEQPKQAFELIKRPGFPAFENAVKRDVKLNDYTR